MGLARRWSFPMISPLSPRLGDPSPWGPIDHVQALGEHAVAVATPSHGGLWVSAEAMASIPAPLRATAYSRGGWFEEDCDWCIPYLALGLHRFEASPARAAETLEAARTTLLSCHAGFASLLLDRPAAPPA
jgi:hypothetical protein